MPKPWGKYEIGYIDHPKFLALTANAHSLWWEGKNYCDKHLTDGLIPNDALKRFRFRGAKSVELLIASCGEKADGEAYAPLWEEHPGGFKMHDYLDHNPCRDERMAGLNRSDAKRKADRERMAEKREANRMSHKSRTRHVAESRGHREEKSREDPEPNGSGKSAEASSAPTFLEFPTQGKPRSWELEQRQVDEWQEAYPALNIDAECRKAREWLIATPTKRKTASGMPRFLVNWFNRAVERGGSPRVIPRPQQPDIHGHYPPCRSHHECIEKTLADGRKARAEAS